MTTLKDLIMNRPCLKLEFLDVLLDFTSHERPDVRNSAIRVTKSLHEILELQGPIEVGRVPPDVTTNITTYTDNPTYLLVNAVVHCFQKYAIYYLKFLLQPLPPQEIFSPGKMKLGECNDNSDLLLGVFLCGLFPYCGCNELSMCSYIF